MKTKPSAPPLGTSSFSRRSTRPCTSRPEFLDRPLPTSPLLAAIGRDASGLLDAHAEAENNLARGENDFLRLNLGACFALAKRIQNRRKSATRLLAKTERNHA